MEIRQGIVWGLKLIKSKRSFARRICKIKKRSHLYYYIRCYVGIILVSATVNWFIFRYNSTSFLISEQLNKYVDRYDFLDPEIDLAAYHKNAKDKLPITIDEFSALMNPSFDNLQATNDSLLIKRNMLSDCKEKMDSLSTIASVMRKDSIERVKERLLFGIQEKIDSLNHFLEGKDSTEMIIEGKYVEMTQLQYEYAKKNAEVQSMIVQFYGSFIPDSLSCQLRRCNEDYIELTMNINELEQTRRDISSRIRDLTIDFHKNRLDAVNYLDFVYYSICVSTTVSFGDIAPNNCLTRTIAIIELLLCIILVAAIVDEIIRKK